MYVLMRKWCKFYFVVFVTYPNLVPRVLSRYREDPGNDVDIFQAVCQLEFLYIDLPQVDLMIFRVEFVRTRSGRASDEFARGRLVSLGGFSF